MERAIVAKSLFGRYRRVVCFALLILACLTARYVIVWYKTRPPNRIHVYDLTWSDKTGEAEAGEEGNEEGDVVYHRWRYYLEPGSYRPLKVEKHSRGNPNDNFILEETLVIEYPTEDEIGQVIKDAGFGHL